MSVSSDEQMLGSTPVTLEMQTQFNYDATAVGLVLTGYGSPHIIWYVGSPALAFSTSGTFAGVPNGSICIDPVNHHTYTKTGALGSGFSGAWAVNS